jgi:hypothetical protein
LPEEKRGKAEEKAAIKNAPMSAAFVSLSLPTKNYDRQKETGALQVQSLRPLACVVVLPSAGARQKLPRLCLERGGHRPSFPVKGELRSLLAFAGI